MTPPCHRPGVGRAPRLAGAGLALRPRRRASTSLAPGKNYLVLRWAQAVTLAIAILGLNIVTGYSGQISIGHSAFFGIGAYTTMILVADHGWPFLATLPVAGAIGFAIGFVIGIPALRIRGLYLSLVTLGIALGLPRDRQEDWRARPAAATASPSPSARSTCREASAGTRRPGSPDTSTNNAWILVTVFVIAIVMFILASNLVRSRVGRGLVAMRDNEIGAAVSRVSTAARVQGAGLRVERARDRRRRRLLRARRHAPSLPTASACSARSS